ncbi:MULTISPECIES: hypothetical protein [unclassified Microcoleus]|uniref:hypothetical protein n=1 Tax=unclassified Microcoleus TaxID=2642155 RepID=UPI001D9EB43C|nr:MULTISPECIES: hypothetical protein [unclassified Microcoleus]MCC3444688.1 hypothetical protein [Microcoleus sp. PH2017_03_ELD_O_A]MCC3507440.1 hypothetical protein [Microcoleus sp. PH2017_19_SFW_U_A]MCC3416208.1 hypothetical protein [Microcoleus sp. PH2017_02_FOX_O_A]MCC3494973.1 hypothetical protein [Microcoleus sp. PH2017_16_JOR_D_A]MCC3519961.1 hypothetical protein [Microcoleus sp. PH2017_18_LLB_O_A]
MKRKTLSFLVVAIITITAGMAIQVNATSQDVQKQNLRSVQAQARASQAIPVGLPTDAKISMKKGEPKSGRVVEIDEKTQKISIERGRDKVSIPLGQIDKIVFSKSAVVYRSNGGPVVRGDGTPAKGRPETWRGIPMNAFRLLDPNKGQADVKLGSVLSVDKLDSLNSVIVGDGKNKRQYVVDEMQFDVQKKTMTIAATPY